VLKIEKKKKQPSVSEAALRKALKRTKGNVTHAADLFDMTKKHICTLTKRYNLRKFALKLRIDAGGSATGRPAST
jgi:transcriptional regulator with GAF, ATPase, and Fis domain